MTNTTTGCNCKEMSCVNRCERDHTHKAFFCERCDNRKVEQIYGVKVKVDPSLKNDEFHITQTPAIANTNEEWVTQKCQYCNGDGYTEEHSDFHNPEDGSCVECPVQVQCDYCHAEGKYMTLDEVRKLRQAIYKEVIEMVEGVEGKYWSKIGSISNIEWVEKRRLLTQLRNKINE